MMTLEGAPPRLCGAPAAFVPYYLYCESVILR